MVLLRSSRSLPSGNGWRDQPPVSLHCHIRVIYLKLTGDSPGQTAKDFAAAAAKASSTKSPPQIQGGVFSLAKGDVGSSSPAVASPTASGIAAGTQELASVRAMAVLALGVSMCLFYI